MDCYTTNQPIGSTCSGVPMPNYCKRCGSEFNLFEQGYYDQYTGKKVFKFGCSKVGCEENCEIFGRHEWKRRFWLASDVKCIKCGYIPRDY